MAYGLQSGLHARTSRMGKSSIVVCKNSWASGTAGVTLCRVQKVLAAMSSGMKTDPRLPSCKTLPGNRLQTATRHAGITCTRL